MLATVGMILLALFVAGLIFTIVVKITTTVGRHLIQKVNKIGHQGSVTLMRKIIEAYKKDTEKENNHKNNDEIDRMMRRLGPDALVDWLEDENGNVDEDSIEIIEGYQVDNKTKKIMEEHGGMIIIDPIPA